VGLVVTGNVMVDRRHVAEAGNVVLEDARDAPLLKAWAQAATGGGGHAWMQLNHPGKQAPRPFASSPMAPSALPLDAKLRPYFKTPRAMTDDDIADVIARFARAAAFAKTAGFTGVQVHGAHGYLVSQFLSPKHNQRKDAWGGSLERRARFVLEVVAAIRKAVGPAFPVGIKLNAADFQQGGFVEEESLVVAEMLAAAGVDLIEISGGSYEAPAMMGVRPKASTQDREAYFLRYAEELRQRVTVPLMVTGGFRTAYGMTNAVTSGATDLVGLARPLVLDPHLCKRVLAGEDLVSPVKPLVSGISYLDALGVIETAWYVVQLRRRAHGKSLRLGLSPLRGMLRYFLLAALRSFPVPRLRA
jgi:2,4-dienoyl-CoA reductase-like NADH-dependent reductase (Old Yellow Enzyme family)